jgi:hypothetical protein
MANFKTYITEHGWNTLLSKGFLKGITSFKVGDSTLIYGIDDGVKDPAYFNLPIVGNREGTTLIPTCEFAKRKPIPVEPLTTSEIIGLDRQVKMSFVSEDCDVPFEMNNVTVTVNLEKWIDNLLALKSTDYVKTASGAKIEFWDYIVGYLQEYDMASTSWVDKERYTSNLDIRYVLKSQEDYDKYGIINPKYMMLDNVSRKSFVNAQSKVRFGSNMLLGFNTKVLEGINVYGTSSVLGLYPDKWGYLVDGIFQNAGDFEEQVKQSGLDVYKTVYPTIVIDGVNYWLSDDTDYRTADGVGYYVWGYKNGEGVMAIDALTDKLKLFMKANATEIETSVYQYTLDFKAELLSNQEFNQAYQNNNIGGNLTFVLKYNENTISSDLYTIE